MLVLEVASASPLQLPRALPRLFLSSPRRLVAAANTKYRVTASMLVLEVASASPLQLPQVLPHRFLSSPRRCRKHKISWHCPYVSSRSRLGIATTTAKSTEGVIWPHTVRQYA